MHFRKVLTLFPFLVLSSKSLSLAVGTFSLTQVIDVPYPQVVEEVVNVPRVVPQEIASLLCHGPAIAFASPATKESQEAQ